MAGQALNISNAGGVKLAGSLAQPASIRSRGHAATKTGKCFALCAKGASRPITLLYPIIKEIALRSLAVFVGVLSLVSAPLAARAALVSGTLTVVVAPPAMSLVINPSNVSEACEVPAGTVVSQLSTLGDDGDPVTFSSIGGDTTDFAISAAKIVTGPNRIATADCGATQTASVTTAQQ